MTPEEHKKRHIELHRAFDELLANFLMENKEATLKTTSLIELIEWSYRQTIELDHEPNGGDITG